MSEPIKPLSPVQAQTPARSLGDDQDRHLERQRTWVLRKKVDPQERRAVERRSDERREFERRARERRSDDRRLGNRLREDRRLIERRRGDRRGSDRRSDERRGERSLVADRGLTRPTALPRPAGRRKGIIDDYA